MRTVLDRAERRKRELTETWQTRYDKLDSDFLLAKQIGGVCGLVAGVTLLGLIQSRRAGIKALVDMEAKCTKEIQGMGSRLKDMERALERDVKGARNKGIASLSKDLFEVVDTLDLAKSSCRDDPSTPDSIAEGVEMVHSSFLKVLQKHGVRAVQANVGDSFNPAVHDADRRLPLVEGAKHNTLADIRAVGYEFGEDNVLLRATKVDVYVDDEKS